MIIQTKNPKSLDDWKYKHFNPWEFISGGDGSFKMDSSLLDKLDLAREVWGRPFIITSAYRDPLYNKQIGGVKNSMHVHGKAVDISLLDYNKEDLYYVLKYAGFTGFGLSYDNFIHADIGRERIW